MFDEEDYIDLGRQDERAEVVDFLLRQAANCRGLARNAPDWYSAARYMHSENLLRSIAHEVEKGRHVAEHPTTAE